MLDILYIASTLKRTGPINQLFNLLKSLDKNIFKVNLVTLSPESEDNRWKDFEQLDLKLYSLDFNRIGGCFWGEKKLEQLIDNIKPKIIHSQGIRADIWVSKIDNSLNKICTIRNYPHLDYKMTYGSVQGSLMAYFHSLAMQKFTKCVGVSDAVTKNLKDKYNLTNTLTIPNGVDTDIYRPAKSDEIINIRKRLGLPVNGVIWISAGHLSYRKDPLFLIRTWKRRFTNNLNNHLVLIGDGELFRACQKESDGSGNIWLQGRINNVSDYLHASDYFISTSQSEGLPNAVLEAIACALPVVLSDIQPHRELFKLNKNIGSLFNLGSEESLIKALEYCHDVGRQVFSIQTRALAVKNFSATKMAKSYAELYNQILSGE